MSIPPLDVLECCKPGPAFSEALAKEALRKGIAASFAKVKSHGKGLWFSLWSFHVCRPSPSSHTSEADIDRECHNSIHIQCLEHSIKFWTNDVPAWQKQLWFGAGCDTINEWCQGLPVGKAHNLTLLMYQLEPEHRQVAQNKSAFI